MANCDPFEEVMKLEKEIDDIFSRFWGGTKFGRALPTGRGTIRDLAPSILPVFGPEADVVEKDKGIDVKINLPGVNKDGVKIKVTEDTVSVSGEIKKEKKEKEENYTIEERYYGSFMRVLSLPSKVDSDKAQANFENGVLEISIPKIGKGKKSKEISL